ncbi:MAG: hypothetical protein JXR97_08080, partial [Planctomycetes bacterium]|nr:hypothetical protein [Planctomycetota bacterium]
TAVATVSGSDTGTGNYISHLPAGEGEWIFDSLVGGDGSAAFALEPGWYFFKVESEGPGGTTCGAVVSFWMPNPGGARLGEIRQYWHATLSLYSPLASQLSSIGIGLEGSAAPAKTPSLLLEFSGRETDGCDSAKAYEFTVLHHLFAESHSRLDSMTDALDAAVGGNAFETTGWVCVRVERGADKTSPTGTRGESGMILERTVEYVLKLFRKE